MLLGIIRSFLEAYGIRYYIHNEHFSYLWPGARICLYNQRWICVETAQREEAQEILSAHGLFPLPQVFYKPSLITAIRNILEILLIGWIVPGNRSKAYQGDEGDGEGWGSSLDIGH